MRSRLRRASVADGDSSTTIAVVRAARRAGRRRRRRRPAGRRPRPRARIALAGDAGPRAALGERGQRRERQRPTSATTASPIGARAASSGSLVMLHQRRSLGQQRPRDVGVVREDRASRRPARGRGPPAPAPPGRSPAAGRRGSAGGPPGSPIRPPPGAGVAHTGRPARSASATAASQPPLASTSGPATSTGLRAASDALGQVAQHVGVGAGAGRSPAARARGRAAVAVVGLRVPVVHRHATRTPARAAPATPGGSPGRSPPGTSCARGGS